MFLTAVAMNAAIFLDMTLVRTRFGGTYVFHLQGRKLAEQEISLQQVARCYLVSFSLIFDPEDGVDMVFRNVGSQAD
jgi:hypothetical protein